MPLLTPASSTPRATKALAPPASRCRPSGSRFQVAKSTFCARLSGQRNLSPKERIAVQRIGEALLGADLAQLQEALCALACFPGRIEPIMAVASRLLSAPTIELLPPERLFWQYTPFASTQELAIVPILLSRARRVLVLATDERFGVYVFGCYPQLSDRLAEDPTALMQQVADELTQHLVNSARSRRAHID